MIGGIDPNTRKCVCAYGNTQGIARVKILRLPEVALKQGRREDLAYKWAKGLGLRTFFLEEPLSYMGIKTAIALAQVSGALKGGAFAARSEVVMVNNQVWKKIVVGQGNASKEQIAAWVQENYSRLYDRYGGDQDVCDAICIAHYGLAIMNRRELLRKRT